MLMCDSTGTMKGASGGLSCWNSLALCYWNGPGGVKPCIWLAPFSHSIWDQKVCNIVQMVCEITLI